VYTSSFLALAPRDLGATIEINDYQRTKLAADRIAEEAVRDGAPIVRTYPGVVYGPGIASEGNLVGRLIADHLKGRLPGLIGPENLWSYAFVDDVAAGHVAAIDRGRIGGRYQLGGENVPQQRLFEIVETLTGRRPPRRIPFPVATALGALEELRVTLTGGTPLVTRGAVEIFRHDWSLDSGEAVRDLGYTITPLDEGVRRTVASIPRS
jgi:farnesol dehydrogenase